MQGSAQLMELCNWRGGLENTTRHWVAYMYIVSVSNFPTLTLRCRLSQRKRDPPTLSHAELVLSGRCIQCAVYQQQSKVDLHTPQQMH